MRDDEGLDGGLEALAGDLRRLPTPTPPATLVARVRRLAHLELAEQADEKLNGLVLGFVLFFSWTVTVLSVLAVRLLRDGSVALFGIANGSSLSWSAAYVAATWFSGAAVIVLIGVHRRREGRLA
jgi:hypothetical protein